MGLLWVKSVRKFGEQAPYAFFWIVWKAGDKIAFEDDALFIQRLKGSFVYLLWSGLRCL